MHGYILCIDTYSVEGGSGVLVERAFGKIIGRRLFEYQQSRRLSDVAVSGLGRVTPSYWLRVRRGVQQPGAADTSEVGERLISGLAVSMPDLLRSAIDEVQEMKAAELERLRGDAVGAPA
jgi:hypothetical protein